MGPHQKHRNGITAQVLYVLLMERNPTIYFKIYHMQQSAPISLAQPIIRATVSTILYVSLMKVPTRLMKMQATAQYHQTTCRQITLQIQNPKAQKRKRKRKVETISFCGHNGTVQ